jgi:hypothetical protein
MGTTTSQSERKANVEPRSQLERDGDEIIADMYRNGSRLSEAQICSRLLMLDEQNLARPPEMRTHDAVEYLLGQGRLRVVDNGTSMLDDPFTRVVEIPTPTLPSIKSLLRALKGSEKSSK